jgi:hypothetical protein
MSLRSPSLRRFVRRALVDATGTSPPDRAQLAAAFDTLCGRLRERLQPVFGGVAIDALFGRAVHVATTEYPWLHDFMPRGQDPCTVEQVSGLGRIEYRAVEDGLSAVLAHNIELLTAFVGEDIVLPLVQQAWDAVAVGDGPAPEGDQ